MYVQPIILGVAGDSASGKTTLTAGLAAILGPDRVRTLCVDDYHRYSRAERNARGLTALHPDCNDLNLMERHLHRLATGQAVTKPVYNHRTGDFDEPRRFAPANYLIVEGMLAFATPRLRDCYHIKIFLDPPEKLREYWKIRRDSAVRGYTPEQVRTQIANRRHDSEEFIKPQRIWADLVVRFTPPPDAPIDHTHLNARLVWRQSQPYPDLNDMIISQGDGPPMLRQRVGHDNGRLTEMFEIDGRLDAQRAEQIETAIWAHLPGLKPLRPNQIGHYDLDTTPRHSYPLGLIQLLIAYQLLLKARA
jgi:phosphoribulokinase